MDKPSEPVAQPESGQATERRSEPGDLQSPGELLAAGRKANELTVDEVGDALNLAPTTVRLLEADDYERLPAAAFTQGYIRNFAKHVGLDADMVVGAYQNKAGKPAVQWESPRSAAGITELVQRYPGVLISAVVAAVVLLIVVTLALVWPEDDPAQGTTGPLGIEQETFNGAGEPPAGMGDTETAAGANNTNGVSDSGLPSTTTVSAGTEPRFDSPAQDSPERSAGSVDRDAIDPNDPLAHLPLAKTLPVGASDSISVGTIGVDSPAIQNSPGQLSGDTNYPLTVTRRLTPKGDDQVRVEVTEDCWVNISSADGTSLFGLLARPGQTFNLTGAGPFRVKLGYTPGVELFFNDVPVLLEPYTRNDVASLVIGQ